MLSSHKQNMQVNRHFQLLICVQGSPSVLGKRLCSIRHCLRTLNRCSSAQGGCGFLSPWEIYAVLSAKPWVSHYCTSGLRKARRDEVRLKEVQNVRLCGLNRIRTWDFLRLSEMRNQDFPLLILILPGQSSALRGSGETIYDIPGEYTKQQCLWHLKNVIVL